MYKKTKQMLTEVLFGSVSDHSHYSTYILSRLDFVIWPWFGGIIGVSHRKKRAVQ